MWESGNYREAIAQFEVVASKNPKVHLSTDALYQIGNIYYLNLRDYQRAIEAYRKLVETNPGNPFSPDAQRKIAEIYREKLGDINGAATEYQRFIKLFPKEADRAMYKMAECYILLKKFDKAREQYETILKEAPDVDYKDEVYFWMANSYYLEGKTGEAKKGFRNFIERFPGSSLAADARFNTALAYEEEGNLDEALLRLVQLRGVYHNERVLDLRIKGIKERIAAKKRPAPAKELKRIKRSKVRIGGRHKQL